MSCSIEMLQKRRTEPCIRCTLSSGKARYAQAVQQCPGHNSCFCPCLCGHLARHSSSLGPAVTAAGAGRMAGEHCLYSCCINQASDHLSPGRGSMRRTGMQSASSMNSVRCMQLASALTASYIGGSINFAAVSASLATPGPLVAAAMAAGVPFASSTRVLIRAVSAMNPLLSCSHWLSA